MITDACTETLTGIFAKTSPDLPGRLLPRSSQFDQRGGCLLDLCSVRDTRVRRSFLAAPWHCCLLLMAQLVRCCVSVVFTMISRLVMHARRCSKWMPLDVLLAGRKRSDGGRQVDGSVTDLHRSVRSCSRRHVFGCKPAVAWGMLNRRPAVDGLVDDRSPTLQTIVAMKPDNVPIVGLLSTSWASFTWLGDLSQAVAERRTRRLRGEPPLEKAQQRERHSFGPTSCIPN